MKRVTWKNPDGSRTICENPTAEIEESVAIRIRNEWEKEREDFLHECTVAIRRLKPGQRRIVMSKPLKMEIENETMPIGDLEYLSWTA